MVLEQVRAELKEVLKVIVAAPAGPSSFHCVAGKDRTGDVDARRRSSPNRSHPTTRKARKCWGDAYLQRYKDSDPQDVLEQLSGVPKRACITCSLI